MDIGLVHRNEYELEADKLESVAIAEAPGRVHLLGDQGGPDAAMFLSAAIDRYARVAVSPRKDSSLRFFAADLGERKRSTLVNLKYRREDRWANYIKVAIHAFAELGFPVKGLNFTVCGNIPQQIALASSTAIEIASAMALRGFFKSQISRQELVKKLISSHTALFEKEVKAADYAAIIFAQKDHFMVIDEAAQKVVKKIKSPLTAHAILLIDSRVPRMGEESEIGLRLSDLKKGLGLLRQRHGGKSFRDFAAYDLMDLLEDFPERVRRRSMHIIQELRRVSDAAGALERKEFPVFARLIISSHESLRDLYEVSCPEVDWLVKRAQEMGSSAGSRMTGYGFGACTYTFVRSDLLEDYKKRIEDYERIFGFRPMIYEVKIAAGARPVTAQGRVCADIAHK